MATAHIFGTLLTANGNMRLLNQMALFGIVINLTLNFILIPLYKSEGAAIATLITQGLTALAQMMIALKVFKLSVHFNHVIRILTFSAILIAGGLFGITYFPGLLGLLLLISLGILLLFGLRIIHLRSILQILRERT